MIATRQMTRTITPAAITKFLDEQKMFLEVSELLVVWADWVKKYRMRVGYPQRSTGMESYGLFSFDEMCDDLDIYLARIADTCVDDLADDQRNAIHHRYLGALFLRSDYPMALLRAHETLARVFSEKGIL